MKNEIENQMINEDITVTETAALRLKSILAGEGKQGHALRLSVIDGGCSGMTYKMSFDDVQGDFDKIFKSHDVQVYCDFKSWLYLKGVIVDYSDDMLSGGFKITNPNATRTCGCGTSFSA